MAGIITYLSEDCHCAIRRVVSDLRSGELP